MTSFSKLATMTLHDKMVKPVETALKTFMPFTTIRWTNTKTEKADPIDLLGVDAIAYLPSRQWMTIQSKVRSYQYLTAPRYMVDSAHPDFTMEYKNAVGTQSEADGEFYYLSAELYFYGWANEDSTALHSWVILDIPRLKMLIERSGGLEKLGKLRQNELHGKASFFAIPVNRIKECWLADSGNINLHYSPLAAVEYPTLQT